MAIALRLSLLFISWPSPSDFNPLPTTEYSAYLLGYLLPPFPLCPALYDTWSTITVDLSSPLLPKTPLRYWGPRENNIYSFKESSCSRLSACYRPSHLVSSFTSLLQHGEEAKPGAIVCAH
ncbi:hypothetical protein F5Y15DRAFT_196487 [Xylariaceae sp. FL0016]|nr:hypothetical protein F5Y15DRAFT_196487 [Xylariaceae sp. FL0016]